MAIYYVHVIIRTIPHHLHTYFFTDGLMSTHSSPQCYCLLLLINANMYICLDMRFRHGARGVSVFRRPDWLYDNIRSNQMVPCTRSPPLAHPVCMHVYVCTHACMPATSINFQLSVLSFFMIKKSHSTQLPLTTLTRACQVHGCRGHVVGRLHPC